MKIDKVEIIWNKDTLKDVLEIIPDRIVQEVAGVTLDLTYPTIPERTGKMKRETKAAGVKEIGNMEYEIGSYVDYAKYPYNMNNETTNWTTDGTNSFWFKEYWLKHGNAIFDMVVERNKVK